MLFTLTEIVLLSALTLTFLHQLYFYTRYMGGCLRNSKREKKGKHPLNPQTPGVSVIICAHNEADNLQNYLTHILEQDYPLFEVIVINDGSIDDTPHILEHYHRLYPQLHITFVPTGARIISSKKLGLTLGVKAAKYDYLLFTDADCTPANKTWIREIMMRYDENTDIVLAYGAYFKEKSLLNRLIQYDTFFHALQFLGMAEAGKPYMGVGRNLSYKKELFIKNNGFSNTLHLCSGDDDLFVNKVANKHNTRIVATPQSITYSIPKNSWSDWLHQKRRHLHVSPYYNTKSKLQIGIEPLTRGAFYLLLILSLCLGGIYASLIALTLGLLRYSFQLIIINLSAKRLKQKQFSLGIIFFDILLPLLNLHMLVWGRSKKKNKIQW